MSSLWKLVESARGRGAPRDPTRVGISRIAEPITKPQVPGLDAYQPVVKVGQPKTVPCADETSNLQGAIEDATRLVI